MSDRDNFSEITKRNLALRAAHRCSVPKCRVLTVMPHSDGERAVLTGRAAHIQAAAPGGARYDANQTPDERKSQANGIWVCAKHGDEIDKDEPKYRAEDLQKWKREHEAWMAQSDLVPGLPEFRLQTLNCLLLPLQGPAVVTGEDANKYRDHDLEIAASSRHELLHLQIAVQFPESLISHRFAECPAGVCAAVQEKRTQFGAIISDGGSVSVPARNHPVNTFTIEVDRLVPGRRVRLHLRTAPTVRDIANFIHVKTSGDTSWYTFAKGSFLYRDQGQLFERIFVVKLDNNAGRKISAGLVEDLADQPLMQAVFW